ncbi:hypothetical protein [Microbacterium forte]
MSTNTTETPRERLERLRAETADRKQAASAAPVVESAALPVRPADIIHAKLTGTTFATGRGFMSASHVTKAGENIVVTQQLIDASRDAGGRSWLRHLVSEEAQLAAWREVRFGLGTAPEGVRTWNRRGDADWVEQREAARREAWSQPTAEARAEALAAVEKRFGPAPTTSVTLNTTPDPSIKLAEEQQAALNAGGVKHVSHYTAVEPGQKGDRR